MASNSSRQILLVCHRWVGLLLFVVILVISLTGASLVFESRIDEALHPELYRIVPGQGRPSLGALLKAVQDAGHEHRVEWVEWYGASDRTAIVHTADGRQIFADPYSATIVGERAYEQTFFGTMFLLHRTLLAGEVGQLVVGTTTLVTVVLLLTGVYLWWPRTRARWPAAFTVRWREGTRRFTYDLHNVGGFYASAFTLIVALTGLVLAFPTVTEGLFAITTSPPPPWKTPCVQPVADGTPVPVDEILRTAEAAVPGAHATDIILPQRPTDGYVLTKRVPTAGNPNAQSHLCLDRYNGAILHLARYEDLSVGATVRLLVYPIHVGAIFGLPTQVMALLVSLMLPVSAITGLLLWSRKRRPWPSPR